MVSDGRRVCGRRRGREDKSGRAERESRNSKSAKSHGNLPFMLGGRAAPRKHPPRARALRHTTDEAAKPSRQWGELPVTRGAARPSGSVRKKGTGGEGASETGARSERFAPPNSGRADINNHIQCHLLFKPEICQYLPLCDSAICPPADLRRSETRGCSGSIRPMGETAKIDRRCRSSKPIPVSLGEQ
jgi:hypothetical protein